MSIQLLYSLQTILEKGNMSHVAIPLFDGESYDLWAVRMQTYLEGLDLWEVVGW